MRAERAASCGMPGTCQDSRAGGPGRFPDPGQARYPQVRAGCREPDAAVEPRGGTPAVSEFLRPHDRLKSMELPDGRAQLPAPLWYQSDLLGGRVVKVRQGFVNDRESIPWYFPVLYVWLAVKAKASRAGTVHDWIYQVHKVENLEVPQALADGVYHEAAALDGNNRLTRWVKWAG